jgi:hypothetical protein
MIQQQQLSVSNKFIQDTGFVLNKKCRDGVFDHAGLRVLYGRTG